MNTGYTPNGMMLGREVMKPADLVFGVGDANLTLRSEDERSAMRARADARNCWNPETSQRRSWRRLEMRRA